MGCGDAKKKVENEMMIMQLERANIQMEREKNLKLLEDMEGKRRKTKIIPDYIDPEFSKAKSDANLKEHFELIDRGIDITEVKRKSYIKKYPSKRRKSKKIRTNENF